MVLFLVEMIIPVVVVSVMVLASELAVLLEAYAFLPVVNLSAVVVVIRL
jgi:hypothetical protein